MKKLALFLVATLIFPFALYFSPKTAVAKNANTYLRVVDHTTPFYQSKEDSVALFFLPYTYYVKILGQTADFYHVEVGNGINQPALDGFVPKQMLFDDGLQVDSAFLSMKITTATTAVLYQDSALSTSLQYVFKDRELCYYGKISHEQENVYFVSYNDRLGYVKEQAVMPFSIPQHPNPLTFLPSDSEDSSTSENSNGSFLDLRFTIVICLLFAGVIGLLVALGKRKEEKIAPNEYYDENEYS